VSGCLHTFRCLRSVLAVISSIKSINRATLIIGGYFNGLHQIAQKHFAQLGIWVTILFCSSMFGVAQEILVGDYSNFKSIQFSGNHSFTDEALRSGLTADPEVILSSHELAPLNGLLQVIQSELERGYRGNGFAEGKVRARAAENRIVVSIDEGPRCLAGKIEFENAGDLPVGELRKRLTQKYPPEEELREGPAIAESQPGTSFLRTTVRINQGYQYLDALGKPVQSKEPMWKPGKPAPFGVEQQIAAVIQEALRDASILQADFEVEIKAQPPDALLRIKFKSHSKPAVLSDILVSGSRLNAPSELLKFLALKPGLPANSEIIRRTELLLYRSARFQSFKVELEYVNSGEAVLHIHVDEAQNTPKLDEPFSRMAQGFLNWQHWLEQLPVTRDSLHARLSSPELGANIDLMVSVNEGAVISIEDSGPGPLRGYSAGLLLSSNGAGLFSPRRGEKFFVMDPDVSSSLTIGVQPSPDTRTNDQVLLLFALSSAHPTNEPVFSLKTMLAPVSFGRIGLHPNFTAQFKGNEMTVGAESNSFRIEEKSGRLIKASGADDVSWNLDTSPPGAIQEYIRKQAGLTNRYDPKRPMGSGTRYVVGELLAIYLLLHPEKFKSQDEAVMARLAFEKLFPPETFDFLDEVFRKSTDENLFAIPSAIAPTEENILSILAAYAFKYSEAIFSRDSWPWKVSREIVFVTKNETTYTNRKLSILYDSPELGPIGYYTIAWCLQYIQSPQATAFAARGLVKLDVKEFRKDYALLLGDGGPLAHSIQAASAKIPSLSEKESAALILAAPWLKPLFLSPPGPLGADSKRLMQVIGPALDQQWEDQWKSEMRQGFQELLQKMTSPAETSPEP
jgi:hypothetical protein